MIPGMKLLAVVALVALGMPAAADDRNVKVEPPPDKLAAAASEAFGKAKAADEQGDLREAERLYRKALAISPHAFTQYNLADVLRRANKLQPAIDGFKKYLEMDPAAKDRTQVEKLIAELDAIPGTVVIDVEESDALVFVDGQPLQRTKDPKKPFVLDLAAGDHVVDVITAISHATETCQAYHGSRRTCRMRLKPRQDGNVVISGPPTMSRATIGRSGEPTIRYKARFALEPGPHEIWASSPRDRTCKPMKIDVAKGDSVVTYVWAELPAKWPDLRGPDGKRTCVDVKYRQRVLRF